MEEAPGAGAGPEERGGGAGAAERERQRRDHSGGRETAPNARPSNRVEARTDAVQAQRLPVRQSEPLTAQGPLGRWRSSPWRGLQTQSSCRSEPELWKPAGDLGVSHASIQRTVARCHSP